MTNGAVGAIMVVMRKSIRFNGIVRSRLFRQCVVMPPKAFGNLLSTI